MAHDALEFGGSVERGAVRGDGVVPAPLGLTDELQDGLHLFFGGTGIPAGLGHDVILRQGFFSHGADFLALAEVFVGPVPQIFLGFPVAGLAGGGDLGERAHDLVIRVLDAALSLVGHMAVGAGHAVLTVGPCRNMLQPGCWALRMGALLSLWT